MRLPPHPGLSLRLALRVSVRAPRRRTLRAPLRLLAPALALALLTGPAAAATADRGQTDGDPGRGRAVVERARQALDGEGGDPGHALRALYRALPRLRQLDPAGADRARGLLTRPSGGSEDTRGDGYQAPSVRRCRGPVCLHWVRSTSDAPTDRAWVRTTLRVVRAVYALQVDELGYRAPLPDGKRGGDGRLDVYLADVGARGLFGYCAPAGRVRADTADTADAAGDTGAGPGRTARTSAAYCVLDNDFATEQFSQQPLRSLRVTAAHELFHAVQLAYDDREDPWLQESTATWMEERFADGANDNRRYLPFGQLRRPEIPLDRFDPSGYAHYGAWVFWEHLTGRFGDAIVREVWEDAAAGAGDPDATSTQALRQALRDRSTPLTGAFARYAAANVARAQEYEEGSAWPAPRADVVERVTASTATAPALLDASPLSSRTVVLRPGEPGEDLEDGRWALEVSIDGPGPVQHPAAYVVVPRAKSTSLRRVALDDQGLGTVVVPVSNRTPRVSLSLVNGSTRAYCGGTTPSRPCRGAGATTGGNAGGVTGSGAPRDDAQGFSVRARLIER